MRENFPAVYYTNGILYEPSATVIPSVYYTKITISIITLFSCGILYHSGILYAKFRHGILYQRYIIRQSLTSSAIGILYRIQHCPTVYYTVTHNLPDYAVYYTGICASVRQFRIFYQKNKIQKICIYFLTYF